MLSCCPSTAAPQGFGFKYLAERHLWSNVAEGWVLFILLKNVYSSHKCTSHIIKQMNQFGNNYSPFRCLHYNSLDLFFSINWTPAVPWKMFLYWSCTPSPSRHKWLTLGTDFNLLQVFVSLVLVYYYVYVLLKLWHDSQICAGIHL